MLCYCGMFFELSNWVHNVAVHHLMRVDGLTYLLVYCLRVMQGGGIAAAKV